jgi:hypothetical protein
MGDSLDSNMSDMSNMVKLVTFMETFANERSRT